MNLNTYQKEAHKTSQYPKIKVHYNGQAETVDWVYATLGLSGETGELVEKLKKILRNKKRIKFKAKRGERK